MQCRFILAGCLLVLLNPAVDLAAQFDVTWQVLNGNWGTATNWTPNTVPNNTGGNTYAVFIDGGAPANATVAMNTVATIDALTIDSGDALTVLNASSLTVLNSLINDGILQITAGINNTILAVGPTTMLTGYGQLLMQDEAQVYISSTVATNVLTNDSIHTIRGGGNLGNNALGIINKGLIDGTGTSYGLRINPSDAGGLVNHHIIQASGGGRVYLQTGNFDNTAGTIQALDASTVFLSGGSITGGTLTSSGSGKFAMTNGSSAQLHGTITNNGLIEITAGINDTILSVGPATTLTGSGQVRMNDDSQAYFLGTVATNVLTNDTGHTIRGGGDLGNNALGIINKGLIDGTGASYGLRIDPSDAGVVNQNIIQASGGGRIYLQTGNFDNTAGTIQALDSSIVFLSGGSITGGTLTSSGSGKFAMTNGSSAQLHGTITNNGLIDITAGINNTILSVGPATTLTGSGQVRMNDDSQAYFLGTVATNVLTNDSIHTIRGGGRLGNNALGIINKGLIDGTGTSYGLVIDPNDAGVTNEGTLQASGSGSLILTSGTFSSSGTMQATGNGTLTMTSGTFSSSGTMQATGSGTLTMTAGTFTSSGIVQSLGAGAVSLTSSASLHNTGIMQSAAGSRITLTGTYTDTSAAQVITNGRLRFSKAGSTTVNAAFSDSATGFTAVDSGVTVNNTGAVVIHGRLGGRGTLSGSVEIAAGGTVLPGYTPGTLTTGNFNFNTGATYFWDFLSGAKDLIQVNGNLDFGSTGTLIVIYKGGTLPAGDFPLFQVTGTIDTLPTWTIQLPGGWSSQGIQIVGNQVVLKQLAATAMHAGDFDNDGDVDGADFVVWQTNFPTDLGATYGDGDGDGDVDGADFVIWQTNFPFTPGPGAAPVPEPAGWLLVAMGGAIVVWRRFNFST